MSVWGWPLAIAASTLAGLVMALLGQGGPWWWCAWAALGLPLAVLAACLIPLFRRRRVGQS